MKHIFGGFLLSIFIMVNGGAEAQFSEINEMADIGHTCFCDKGTRQVSPCNKTKGATCEPCPKGEFQDSPNNKKTCKRCSICPRTSRPSRPCIGTQDAECICVDANHHFSKLLGYCSECTPCMPGHEALTECNFSHDRTCQRCPRGTFSDTVNGRCRSCSLCHKYTVRCNSTHDSVCHITRGKEKESNFVLPLVACLCVIILAVLVYFCVRRKRCLRRKDKCFGTRARRQRQFVEREEIELHVQQSDPVPGPSEGSRLMEIEAHESDPVPGTSNGWRLVENELQESDLIPVPSEGSQLMEIELYPPVPMGDLKYQTIEAIAVKLNGKCENNWTKLAKVLGVDKDTILCLEQVPLDATQLLLQEYTTRKCASVQGLYRMLVTIDRKDAAKMLLPYLKLLPYLDV